MEREVSSIGERETVATMRKITRWPALLVYIALMVALLGSKFSGNRQIESLDRGLYDTAPVIIPANIHVAGAFEILYRQGPQLHLKGWAAPIHSANRIQTIKFLLDGAPVPYQLLSTQRLDVARQFDRLELFTAGFHAILSLPPLKPGQHKLLMRLAMADGQSIDLQSAELGG